MNYHAMLDKVMIKYLWLQSKAIFYSINIIQAVSQECVLSYWMSAQLMWFSRTDETEGQVQYLITARAQSVQQRDLECRVAFIQQ